MLTIKNCVCTTFLLIVGASHTDGSFVMVQMPAENDKVQYMYMDIVYNIIQDSTHVQTALSV